MKFKRAMLTEPGKFELFEVDETPGDKQILVKIASCGLCNWELNFWQGNLNFLGYPHPLGHEWAGVVVEAGPGCTRFRAGDKVTGLADGFGGFAEYKVADEADCEKLESHVDTKYAMGEPQKCIVTVLRAVAPEAGDFGVVLGCGPMGLWCIQALAGKYLGELIAIDTDQNKLNMARRYGATQTICVPEDNAEARIREITKGRMADFVIEGTGIPALLNQAQSYMKSTGRGRLALMSSHEDVCREFDFRKAIERSLKIIVPHPGYSCDQQDDFRRAVTFINQGTFRNEELVTHEFRLENIEEAFRTLEHRPKGYIKGVVIP